MSLTPTGKLTPWAFKQLPRRTQRVLVAQDVLDLIRLKKLVAESGTYFATYDSGFKTPADFLNDKNSECRVCAIGSCLVALADKRNHMTFAQLERGTNSKANTYLAETFTIAQRIIMESAFEGSVTGDASSLYSNLSNNAQLKLAPYIIAAIRKFRMNQDDDEKVLKAIMRYLVKNGGEFNLKPYKIPKDSTFEEYNDGIISIEELIDHNSGYNS